MNLSEYKAGVWRRQQDFRAFFPVEVNHAWTWNDPRINTLLEEARGALGELNAFSLYVPDIDLFIEMHVVKEATESSRIEGTRTEMGEALRPEEEIDPERRDDWREVRNYVQAMNEAIHRLESLPLSNRLLREAHATLMQGVRGEHKDPGEWRRSPNWIGGSRPDDAVFVPPPHHEVPELMGDLEKFWHNERIDVPNLIRIAISHYQFETIHPFLDGNGRIGRLLIPLFLIDKGLLAKPSLYISSFFEKKKGQYYDALTTVRGSNDLGQWIRFFLVAIRETAQQGRDLLREIMELRRSLESKILTLGARAERGRMLLNRLYKDPYVTVAEVTEYFDVTYPTAGKLVGDFERLGILEEVTGYRRNRLYMFTAYYRLFIDGLETGK